MNSFKVPSQAIDAAISDIGKEDKVDYSMFMSRVAHEFAPRFISRDEHDEPSPIGSRRRMFRQESVVGTILNEDENIEKQYGSSPFSKQGEFDRAYVIGRMAKKFQCNLSFSVLVIRNQMIQILNQNRLKCYALFRQCQDKG